jgi:mono/diheme cytochrome c family protein
MLRLTFWLALGVLAAAYAALKLLVHPPVPASVMTMYMVLAAIAVLVFVAADERRFRHFCAPLAAVFDGSAPWFLRAAVLLAIPLVAAWTTYVRVAPSLDAPFEPRVVHPEPPARVTVHGKAMQIAGLQNPLRAAGGEEHLAQGKTLYYQNCFFCHGDALAGDGHFAHAFRPIPANFRDIGTISMLQESFVFWRVATGGPGLPRGATPWNSSMPVWQDFLSEEEIWKVILYIYAGSGSTPRTWGEEVKHDKH